MNKIKATPSSLAAASIGFGALSAYLYLKSKTSTVGADLLDVLTFIKWKRDISRKLLSDWSIADSWEDIVASQPQKVSLYFIDETLSYTFAQVTARATQG